MSAVNDERAAVQQRIVTAIRARLVGAGSVASEIVAAAQHEHHGEKMSVADDDMLATLAAAVHDDAIWEAACQVRQAIIMMRIT